jgi:diacylglycerol kinase (ATP)
MGKPGNTGLKRIIKAGGYSFLGLKAAWKYESAFRQEVLLAAAMIPGAVWLGRTADEIGLLIGTVMLVVIVELLNSAVEAVVDRIGDEPHKLSGRAKDMGSAAVFISLLLVLVIWGAIALDRFAPGLI